MFQDFRFTRRYYYQNIDCGNILTLDEMLDEAEQLYDFGDYSNAIELCEYYELTTIKCK